MGLLYILVGIALLVAAGTGLQRLRLRRLRAERLKKGVGRKQFVDDFRHSGIHSGIPGVVYDYYSSKKGWRDFPFSPDDEYSKVLYDDPLDVETDARIILERLGLPFPPEYAHREREDRPIRTLKDMVSWLEWASRRSTPT